jgi:hypothetical protein
MVERLLKKDLLTASKVTLLNNEKEFMKIEELRSELLILVQPER